MSEDKKTDIVSLIPDLNKIKGKTENAAYLEGLVDGFQICEARKDTKN